MRNQHQYSSKQHHYNSHQQQHHSPTFERSKSGSRLDLSFATANFPEDYLPYTASYSRNKEPYLVWDNGINADSTSDGHYQHTTASIDSHSPASLNHYHLQSHNHLYPTCSASSASWPSSKKRKCCGFSCGCCAVSILAVIIIAALATVVGFSVYLAMITNLHKSSLISVNGSFKVESGDNFTKNLLNTSSTEFMTKSAKYETIIKTALESSAINNAITKQEVYAFRKGSLIVFFRIYLDRRKIDIIIDSETKDDEKNDLDEVLALKLVQREMKDGMSQLKITGKSQIIIDIKSIQVTNDFDSMIDHNVNDIKTSSIASNKASIKTNSKDPKLLSTNVDVKPKTNATTIKPTLPSVTTEDKTVQESNTTSQTNTSPLINTTFSTVTHLSTITTTHSSIEPELRDITTNKFNYKFTNSDIKSTTGPPKSQNNNPYIPFTRRQSTTQTSIASSISSTNLRITTRSRLRSTTSTSTPLPPSVSSQPPQLSTSQQPIRPFGTRTDTNKLPNSPPSQPSNEGSALLKRTEVRDDGLKVSGLDFGHWKPVIPQQMKPALKPLPPKPIPPPLQPQMPSHAMPSHVMPQHLAPLLKPPPHVGVIPPNYVANRPILRIPLPIGIGMREVPRLMDNGGLNFNFSVLSGITMRDERFNTTASHEDMTTLTTLLPIRSSTTRSSLRSLSTASPTMVDGFLVPVSATQGSQSEVSLHTPVINEMQSYLNEPVRDVRKNKSMSALLEKPTTKNSITSVKDDSYYTSVSFSSGAEIRLHDIPEHSRPSVPELSVGSPVLHLSRPTSDNTKEKVKETISANNPSVRDLSVGSPTLTINQTSNRFESTFKSNSSAKVIKTKSPFEYYSVINETVFSQSSTFASTPFPFTTTSIPQTTHQSVRESGTVQPFLRRTVTSTPLPNIEVIAGFPLGIDKNDQIVPEKLIRPLDSSEPVYGERLPKYIPPALYQKFPPSNDITNSEIGLNGAHNDDDADEALYDDEIASFNQTSLITIVNSISSLSAENLTTTSQVFETTTTLSSCIESEFQCGSGECLSARVYCNRRVECSDGSDEMTCTCANYLRAERQYRKICDGIVDCEDASDEINCPYCKESYVCSGSNLCIDKSKICNGDNDCPNGEDESECISLVNDEQTPDTTGRYFNSEGALYIRQKGEWAPLCLDYLNTNDLDNRNNRNSENLWKIEDLGKAICRANSFHDLESVGLISLAKYKSNVFFKMEEPNDRFSPSLSMWSSIFEKSECSSRKTTYVKCSGFECGVRPLANGVRRRIVGGQSASLGSWPWQVALYREGEFQCGGVIINSEWLLTAAHCFHATRNAYWTARFGILRRGNLFPTPYEQLRRITHVIIHSEYVDKGFINDIALLRLNQPINYSKHVRPICLPSLGDDVSKWHRQLCTTIGWGKLFEHGRIFPDTLQEVKLPVISTEECRKRTLFLPLYKITDNMFCAGYDRGGRDACLGDSGGPMMCQKRDGKWFLLGVTSNGDGCGRAGRPGVYTKVAKYMDWIENTINGVLEEEVNRSCDGLRCPLGRCLKKESICNGIMDCRDASDEQNCSDRQRSSNNSNYYLNS